MKRPAFLQNLKIESANSYANYGWIDKIDS